MPSTSSLQSQIQEHESANDTTLAKACLAKLKQVNGDYGFPRPHPLALMWWRLDTREERDFGLTREVLERLDWMSPQRMMLFLTTPDLSQPDLGDEIGEFQDQEALDAMSPQELADLLLGEVLSKVD